MSLPERSSLDNLAAAAPAFPHAYELSKVKYPFSNDDSIHSYMKAFQVRQETESFLQAKLPVAVVAGEAALLTAVHFIPEPAIVVIDNDINMLGFMRDYIDASRRAYHAEDWRWLMGLTPDSGLSPAELAAYEQCLQDQVDWWNATAPLHKHALTDRIFFKASQHLFRTKTIIPWLADLANPADMQYLGQQLREQQASITMLNLSNVIPTNQRRMPDSTHVTRLLEPLPLTPDAPILTFSTQRAQYVNEATGNWEIHPRMVMSTGPFGGLADLQQDGGDNFGRPTLGE